MGGVDRHLEQWLRTEISLLRSIPDPLDDLHGTRERAYAEDIVSIQLNFEFGLDADNEVEVRHGIPARRIARGIVEPEIIGSGTEARGGAVQDSIDEATRRCLRDLRFGIAEYFCQYLSLDFSRTAFR